MVVGAVLLAIVAVVWFQFLWSRRRFYMCALKIKGPWGYPFIGIVHKIYKLEGFISALHAYAKEYKMKTYFTWLGPFPMIFTSDAKIAEIVLQSPDCLNKPIAYDLLDEGIGNGLLTSKTPKWTKHRKLLNPCFGYKVLLEKMPQFNNFARDLCAQMDTFVGCGEVNIKELALNMGLKASIVLTMGTDVEEESSSNILKSFDSILGFIIDRMSRPWLKSMMVYSWSRGYKPFMEARTGIRKFIEELVMIKLKAFQNTNPETNLDQYSEEKEAACNVFINQAIRIHQRNEFTIEDVIDEAGLMVIAAYETTATILYSTLMFLAMYPEFQERVFDEISTLYHDKQFDVSYDDFKSLLFLEMCINETLRLTPTATLIGRVCEKDVRVSEDFTIPAGVEVYIDIFHIHRDEDIWGSTAKTYNPDRFLPSILQDRQKCAFLPFSKGKRNCVGGQYARMFLKVMLAQILRKYKFSTTFRYEDVQFVPLISLKYVTTPCLEVQRR